MQRMRRRGDVDMTQGSEFRHILLFALPLLVGNIFQQLYNTVDSWVVGNFASNEAFAAVGTVGPIINMLIGLFAGLASGAGVVISQYYGAKNHEKVHDTVHTAIAMTAILTIILTAVGVLMTPAMLRFMKTPEEVFPESSAYLTIYFGGMIGLLFYNMGAGILRAVGDSRRPFYFLLVSAVTNTLLDLLFVIKFHMGVVGVAVATVLAQALSALLTIITLMRSQSDIKLVLRDIRLDFDMLGKIVRVGIPAALQMAVTAFSNVFVQSYINQFGANCMSGWTAYGKIDQFIFMPMQSLALAATTFVGQNLGIGQVKRARKGARTALLMAFGSTIVISTVVIAFAPQLVYFFNQEAEVVRYGTMFLTYLTPFYFLCCVNQVYSAALRGAGDSRAPMIIMLASFVVFRQIYLFLMSRFAFAAITPMFVNGQQVVRFFSRNVDYTDFCTMVLAMGYPAGWLVCSVSTLIYYQRADIGKNRLTA